MDEKQLIKIAEEIGKRFKLKKMPEIALYNNPDELLQHTLKLLKGEEKRAFKTICELAKKYIIHKNLTGEEIYHVGFYLTSSYVPEEYTTIGKSIIFLPTDKVFSEISSKSSPYPRTPYSDRLNLLHELGHVAAKEKYPQLSDFTKFVHDFIKSGSFYWEKIIAHTVWEAIEDQIVDKVIEDTYPYFTLFKCLYYINSFKPKVTHEFFKLSNKKAQFFVDIGLISDILDLACLSTLPPFKESAEIEKSELESRVQAIEESYPEPFKSIVKRYRREVKNELKAAVQLLELENLKKRFYNIYDKQIEAIYELNLEI